MNIIFNYTPYTPETLNIEYYKQRFNPNSYRGNPRYIMMELSDIERELKNKTNRTTS